MKKFWLTVVIGFWIYLVSATSVKAAEYVFEEWGNNSYSQPQVLRTAQNYKFIYGILTQGEGTVDYYNFDLTEFSPQFHIELFVPVRTIFTDFRPSLLVTDPYTKHLVGGVVPFGFPSQIGGRIYPWEVDPQIETTEAGAFQKVWAGPKFIKDLAENHYTFGVFDPSGKGGRYMLKVGMQNPAEGINTWLGKIMAFIRVKTDLY